MWRVLRTISREVVLIARDQHSALRLWKRVGSQRTLEQGCRQQRGHCAPRTRTLWARAFGERSVYVVLGWELGARGGSVSYYVESQ